MGYIEILPECQKVLEKNIESGELDRAPLYDDICGNTNQVILVSIPFNTVQ